MNRRRTSYSLLSLLCLLALVRPAIGQVNQDCTGNEAWVSTAAGLPGEAVASTEMNGNLYVLHRGSASNDAPYQISTWDGSAWTPVTSAALKFAGANGQDVAEGPITGFQAFNGSIYMAGSFTAVDNNSTLAGLVRWDGSAWSSASGNLGIKEVSALTVHNGNLIASATVTGSLSWKIVQFDGTTWSYVGGENPQMSNNGAALALISWNGSLYAGGERMRMFPGEPDMVARWDGTQWSSTGIGMSAAVTNFFVYNNKLYAVGPWLRVQGRELFNIVSWDGSQWNTDVPQPNRRFLDAKMAIHDNQVYMISSTDTNLTPGSMREFPVAERFDGTTWHIVSNFDGHMNFLANYNGSLLAGGKFQNSCGTPLANFAKLCNDQNCGRITGTVYYDNNGNCTQDVDEPGLARRMVEVTPGPHYAMTDADGNYSRYIEDGTYTVGTAQHLHWNRTCPTGSGTHSVTVTGASGVSDIDFGTQPIPGIQDLRISTVTGMARQGRAFVYAITYQNVGTMTMNGTVRLFHDPILTFDSAEAAATRYTPNVVEWDFSDLKMEESRTIKVYTTVPITIPMGSDICSRVEIDPQSNDFSVDNRDSVCTPVTGGYDPNDISVTPYGVEDNGVITPEENVLTYRVRFQNTGNDTAFKVVVVDQLNANLDIASIRLGAASHPYSFSIDKDNQLTWTFEDIMLPDSNASEVNSHGFFKFSVNMKPNLPHGTEIPNHVDIYFDYNVPVRTNTVVSVIGASMGVDPAEPLSALHLFPNPARDVVQIQAELRTGSSMTLRNLLGETLRSYSYTGGAITLDVRDLPAGTYLLTLETSEGPRTERITILR